MNHLHPPPAYRPKILLIDDSATVLLLLTGWLEGDYDVVQATSGEEGLIVAEAERPDLILLDLLMPGIDGIETCRRLRERPSHGFLPILILTADEDQERRNAALEAGASDFLRKPIDARELLLRVRSFVTIGAQDRLIRSQLAELQRLDGLKEDLVALVTHDLLNALAGVVALLEVVQESGPSKPEDLEPVVRAALRMKDTLGDMLRVKRLEDGELRPELVSATVRELLADAVAMAEPQAQVRGVAIHLRGELERYLTVDVNLVRRSVFNLLQNAVKFSPRGGAVTVDAARAGDGMRIRVCDQGPGVSTEDRPRLFQKYGHSGPRRGHGLGLYLVGQVAAVHHGRAWVEPATGRGSVFVLELPLA